jgi:hypothetical protein
MKLTLTLITTLTLFVGCVSKPHIRIIEKKPQLPQPIVKQEPYRVKQSKLPPAPKKHIKLKEIKDTNYSDTYMYPEDTSAAKKDPVKKTETPVAVTSNSMSREECIAMISQEKFDKYSAMFGSEAASIKRCTMLKAMKK